LASEFCPLPTMISMTVGYGAGDHNPDGWSNVLRLFVEEEPTSAANQTERMIQIDTNLDDLSPQTYEYIMEQLFRVGAVDVVLVPVIMKKSRPGILLSCLATEDRTDAVIEVLFQETTTLGVRLHEVRRRVLTRRFVPVTTHGGVVRMKVAEVGAGWEKAAPEYEDCKAIAQRTGHPLKTVMEEALMAYRRGRKKTRITTARGRA